MNTEPNQAGIFLPSQSQLSPAEEEQARLRAEIQMETDRRKELFGEMASVETEQQETSSSAILKLIEEIPPNA